MALTSSRRTALVTLGIAIGMGALGRAAADAAGEVPPLSPAGALLGDFSRRLAAAPRRRSFTTVPMILDNRSQWDSEALDLLLGYRGEPRQVWDQTEIDSPWLNLMRNSLNAQVFSFRHPDFLVVSATHGSAHLALFDQPLWDKYSLAKLAGDEMANNSLIVDKPTSATASYQDPAGAYSPAGNSIPALMRRGVVFLACHNAIWETAGKLIKAGTNPGALSQEALAAELTNHLVSGVILTPGVVATIPELQRAGFVYIK